VGTTTSETRLTMPTVVDNNIRPTSALMLIEDVAIPDGRTINKTHMPSSKKEDILLRIDTFSIVIVMADTVVPADTISNDGLRSTMAKN
jgi:hypothetical protein